MEPNDLPAKLALPPHPAPSFIKNLMFFRYNNFIHVFAGVRKTFPRKKALPPPVRVRGRGRVSLGKGLGLRSGMVFSVGIFSWNRFCIIFCKKF